MVSATATGLVLLAPGAQHFALAQVQPDPIEQALAALDDYLVLVQALRDQIDRTQFDVDDLAFELAFEAPETIIAWVRDNVAFEQYPGLLRGAQGTLMSRAGNALDQAVLLVALLEGAGYETRLVRGRLDAAASESLVGQMAEHRPAAPDFGDLAEIERILAQVGELLESPDLAAASNLLEEPELTDTELYRSAMTDANWLLETVAQEGGTLGEEGAFERLLEEARDYVWVQVRQGGGDWTDAHPAFATATAATPAIDEIFDEGVPAALQHRFRFASFIERKEADVFETLPVMAPWEQTAADLGGTILSYTHLPDTIREVADLEDLEKVLTEAEAFYPFFNGEPAPGAMVFDVEGFAFPPAIATDPTAELVREQGQAVEGATGLFNTLPGGDEEDEEDAQEVASDDLFTLTAHWFEYTLIAPDGSESVHRRISFDRRGEVARAAGGEELAPIDRRALVEALTASTSFLLATGTYAEGFLFDLQLERMQAMAPVARALLDGTYEEAGGAGNAPWLGHLDLYQAFDRGAAATADVSYRSEPSLTVRQQTFGDADSLRITLDIVSNHRRAFSVDGGQLQPDPQQAVRVGVWETWAEGQMLAAAPSAYVDAPGVFAQVREAGIPFRLLTNAAQLAEVTTTESARSAIRADLEAGFAVLAPERLPAGTERAAWWRVDLASGQTLGMIDPGLGGVSAEWVIIATAIGVGAIVTISTFFSCFGNPANAGGSTTGKLVACGICGAIAGSIAAIGVFLAFEGAAAAAVGAGAAMGGKVAAGTTALIGSLCNFYGAFA